MSEGWFKEGFGVCADVGIGQADIGVSVVPDLIQRRERIEVAEPIWAITHLPGGGMKLVVKGLVMDRTGETRPVTIVAKRLGYLNSRAKEDA